MAFAEQLSSEDTEHGNAELRDLARRLRELRRTCADSLTRTIASDSFVTEELKGLLNLRYETAGEQILAANLWKPELQSLYAAVTNATPDNRRASLQRLGQKAYERFATDKTTPDSFREIASLTTAIGELGGSFVIGTEGKKSTASTAVILGTFGCLGVILLMCSGVLTPAINQARDAAQKRAMQSGIANDSVASTNERRQSSLDSDAASKKTGMLSAPPSRTDSPGTATPPNKASFGRPIVLDAKGVEDLIDHPNKLAGKILVLSAQWNGRETLREGGDGSWPFEIGGESLRTGLVSSRITSRQDITIRISSSDVLAEFKSIKDLPSVGGVDRVTVTILFDGDFNNCRLLTLKRK